MRLNFKRLALLGAHAARGLARVVELTPARLDFVTMLVHGPLCQRDLAARLCVSEAVVSRMVRALMRDGLVSRVIPAADRRFRVVSLTEFGRHQYLRLTRSVWFLPADARRDGQSLGEGLWCIDWEGVLRVLRLDFLLQTHETDGPPTPETPFAAIRRHHRRGVYRDPIRGVEESLVDAISAWSVRDTPPPLHEGLLRDPLSDRYQAAWRPPVGSTFVPDLPPELLT